jgi:hypothetical protein
MLKGILNITICPQDDRFEVIDVTSHYSDEFYDISINTLLDEPFHSIITGEKYIQDIIDSMNFNLDYEEFKDLFPFYRYVLEHVRDKDFFTNADIVYINGIYEDVAEYLRRNPELLDKEIILAESLELDKNTCIRLKEVFKEFPNIKLMIQGNREFISLEQYEKTIDAIDNIVDKIKRYDYSPLEQLILAYDLIRDRFYVHEDANEDYSVSRDLTSTLLGDKIVCMGFANIFNAVCKKLDINSMMFILNRKDGSHIGHARNMVHLVDEKYGIDGLYFFDPTFDCKKDEKNNFLFSYRFFAKDYKEISELSRGIYYPRDFKIFESESFEELVDKSDELPGDLALAFNLLTEYKMSTLLKFLGEEMIEPLRPGYSPDDIIDAAYDIKERASRSIGAETFLKALYIVRKNQYYENPGKYMFDVDALTKIITNSRFRADGSAELELLNVLGFNYYYNRGSSEEKVRGFIQKNDLEIDIERTKLARTLRTILEVRTEEDNKGKKL